MTMNCVLRHYVSYFQALHWADFQTYNHELCYQTLCFLSRRFVMLIFRLMTMRLFSDTSFRAFRRLAMSGRRGEVSKHQPVHRKQLAV